MSDAPFEPTLIFDDGFLTILLLFFSQNIKI